MKVKNEEELQKLQLNIDGNEDAILCRLPPTGVVSDAQENLGDIEQRDAILNKGEFYLRIGTTASLRSNCVLCCSKTC